MARLPSARYLIQQIGPEVILYEDETEREIVRYDPSDTDATAKAQKTIHGSELSDEDKSFAHFWSGYFYAHAAAGPERVKLPPQAIGYVNHSALSGQSVTVITRTGEVLDLGPELPPLYAGEDLTAGQPVEYASWLSGRAVVGVTT